jgi:hypothetical protein
VGGFLRETELPPARARAPADRLRLRARAAQQPVAQRDRLPPPAARLRDEPLLRERHHRRAAQHRSTRR